MILSPRGLGVGTSGILGFFVYKAYTPKFNIEPENDGLEDDVPFPGVPFSGSMLNFRRVLGKMAKLLKLFWGLQIYRSGFLVQTTFCFAGSIGIGYKWDPVMFFATTSTPMGFDSSP